MGQKVNPISLRLEHTNLNFDNSWYSNSFYKKLITRDVSLHIFFNNFLKSLKLPTGRYSIQHLQKKTQVFSFLCYPKFTRDWRTKIFGLSKKKKSLKKTRFFFKNKNEFQKKIKKNTKLVSFYTTLNQQALYKIQKKITSFQNYVLWSTLFLKSQKNVLLFYNKVKPSFSSISLKNIAIKNLAMLEERKKKESFPKGFTTLIKEDKKSCKGTKSLFLNKGFTLSKERKRSLFYQTSKPFKSFEESQINQDLGKFKTTNPIFFDLLNKKTTSLKLFFLQNLFVYKTLKSNLKLKKNINLLKSKKTGNQLNFDSFFFKNQKEPLNLKYKNYLESSLYSTYKLDFNITPFIVENDWQHANFLADEIVYFLERRIPFRRLKKKLLKQLSKIDKIRGVRITCSGRVGGKSKKAQRAKTECIKYGQTSLQVFSSKIDFSVKTAFTSFGSVGVKVWICYN